VVRKQISRRPQAAGRLLFEDQPDYRFSLYVTKLEPTLDQVWKISNSRADCENRIRALKEDFGLDAFCLQDFWATEASFRLIMVVDNLMSLFRHFALNDHHQATPSLYAPLALQIGGWANQHARKRFLKLSLPRQKRPWMDSIFRKIDAQAPPFSYPIA
jgi:hypothetical protein